ncbi:thioredoxin family protein [Bacteroidetes/Chlorobi group bacterium ChocPot_Mid]|jgi:peroxiredoxin|nr:MAG: thioredoxin family protein [Bacteroidetes/Chlorobi group bacterium ChocPot_Mid]
MAETASKMIALGTKAPDFTLPDTVSGKELSLNELKSEIATVVMFICNHCPYVIHINKVLVDVANRYIKKGISFIAVSSNDVANYPEDSPSRMKEQAIRLAYPFPYLYDETQSVARAYDAACTPDFFVFDKEMKLVYRGQFDDARPGNGIPVTGQDLSSALDAILKGEIVFAQQKPSMGCNIKWKK